MKYICIDTNIFIQCCLLELEEGDDINSLEDLIGVLDKNEAQLLLPEIIQIEFHRKLNERFEGIEKSINKHKENIGLDSTLPPKVKQEMINNINECISERNKNKIKVEKSISKIFSHRNTITDGMKIDGDLMAEGFRRSLTGKKPCKKGEEFFVNMDCLILESIKKHLKLQSGYQLYFCSGNIKDFTESLKDKKEEFIISPDIKNDFSHIEYFSNLISLLRNKFKVKYKKGEINKIKKAEETLRLIDAGYWQSILDKNFIVDSSVSALNETKLPDVLFSVENPKADNRNILLHDTFLVANSQGPVVKKETNKAKKNVLKKKNKKNTKK